MSTQPIIVCGGGLLSAAIVERLETAGRSVAVISARPSAASLTAELARTGGAAALVLAEDDDSGNVDTALVARRIVPELPIVIRLFDAVLGDYLRRSVVGTEVLSMSAVSAPTIVEHALGAARQPGYPGRGSGRRAAPMPSRRGVSLDRVLALVIVLPLLVVAASTAYFSRALELSPLDALYFVTTTISTVGYGDITPLHAAASAKLATMLLMIAGAALIAVVYAFLSGWVVERRLEVLAGRVPVRRRDHAVIVGGGNLGFRVAAGLAEAGFPVVLIEREAGRRHVASFRAETHHVIVGDVLAEETLTLARVESSRVVVAVTEHDATNLFVALTVGARAPEVPVILRVDSPELARHVNQQQRGAIAVSPVALAAERFCDAALGGSDAGPR